MTQKNIPKQAVKRRKPMQERSQEKIELILEAATRILHKQGMTALTTNEIAAVSGVSIGTIYQYFSNKEEVILQLSQRERAAVMGRLLDALNEPNAHEPVRILVREMLGAFKGRSRVYKELMDAALAKGLHKSGDPSFSGISLILAAEGLQDSNGKTRDMSDAEVFVLTHAFLGATRAFARSEDKTLDRAAVEDALVRLVQRFTTEG
jgi:AcrR family transcriptional regulator